MQSGLETSNASCILAATCSDHHCRLPFRVWLCPPFGLSLSKCCQRIGRLILVLIQTLICQLQPSQNQGPSHPFPSADMAPATLESMVVIMTSRNSGPASNVFVSVCSRCLLHPFASNWSLSLPRPFSLFKASVGFGLCRHPIPPLPTLQLTGSQVSLHSSLSTAACSLRLDCQVPTLNKKMGSRWSSLDTERKQVSPIRYEPTLCYVLAL